MFIVTVVLSVVLALAFLGAGFAKITAQPAMVEGAEHLGFSLTNYKLIGVLETLGGIGVILGLWVAPLGIAAAVGLTLTMIGAVGFHLKAGDGPKIFTPAAVLGVLALVVVILRSVTA